MRRLGAIAPAIALLFCGELLTGNLVAENPDDVGMQRAEALLAAMGGREAWSKVKFVHVERSTMT